ncbi:GerMN domain-containing protein [Deinococcus peraridilitoris]|uniref:Sporulation/spore germination protein n=1 Tax=Deinococcus peraridilitoris (strain DSM 19664 / LMG 22246 / CIP 109416 / KR-200) TaxID=937777 RepID=L0A5H9_DEIPD|nr:GerMN domain-containing protein [Deinococcus peraridilitoris]AFZ69133.1 sporulation/spore germination protein [Deinococcus peraridilitoris DSM 19664]
MRSLLTPFNFFGLIVLALSALAYHEVNKPLAVPEVPQYGAPAKRQDVNVLLYFSDPQVQGFQTEQRTLQVTGNSLQRVAQAALEALQAGPTGDGLRTLPEGDTPQVWVRGEHLYVDLPQAYSRLNYGTSGENMLVCSVANTLLDLRGARDVTFLVNGKNAETLLGHLDLRAPFTKDDCKL